MSTDTLTSAVIASGTTKTKVCKNFIDGEWVESVSDGLSKTATPRTRAKSSPSSSGRISQMWTQPWFLCVLCG